MPIKKCISGCRGFPNNTCENAPRCMYVNGRVPRYQYCRLSSKYKMGKYPNCKVTKRLKKAEIKRNASVRINQFVNEN